MPNPKRILRGLASLPSALDARLRGKTRQAAPPGAPLPLGLPLGTGSAMPSTLAGGSRLGGGGPPGGGSPGDPDAPAFPEQFAPLDAVRGVYAQTSTQAGDVVSNTSARTDFASSCSFAASDLPAGAVIRGCAAGTFTTASGSPPNLSFYASLGGVDVVHSFDLRTFASASGAVWRLEFQLTVRAGGASGSVYGNGCAVLQTGSALSSVAASQLSGAHSIDLSAGAEVKVGAKWSAADVANVVTLDQLVVDLRQ